MSPTFIVTPHARVDLVDHFVFIGQDNVDAAHRFATAAEQAFQKLAEMPGLGHVKELTNPNLKGVRSWRIRGFENWLVLYRPTEQGIEVLRVLHGARDVSAVLENEG